MSNIIQYVTVPIEEFNLIKEKQDLILRTLQNLKLSPTVEPDFITAQEWMDKCKVSRWKFDILKNSGRLPIRQVGRKYYVPRLAVQEYFDGKYTIDD